jgi:predicted RNA methylase
MKKMPPVASRKLSVISKSQAKLVINKGQPLIDLKNAAVLLGVSIATVKNWVKCGHLQTSDKGVDYFFHKKDLEGAKLKIKDGGLNKLNKRANKIKSSKTFVPEEYSQDKSGIDELNVILDFIKSNNIETSSALLLVCLNLLKKEKIIPTVKIQDIKTKKSLPVSNKQIKKEIKAWLSQVDTRKIKKSFSFLLECAIPVQRDFLGLLYQSLLFEGQKSQNGSYYTPPSITNEMVAEHTQKYSKVLDPCCGTGQFLLAFSDVIEDPSNIYGIDFDNIAVMIARINILIKFKNIDFVPNIVCKNTLLDIDDKNMKDFDIIATNPPWGIHFSGGDIEKLKKLYPTIMSFESFSYFLEKSINLARSGGMISFILPESISNVRTHKDIREIILKSSQITKITYLNRVFKNVFTPVIRMDIKKGGKKDASIQVCKEKMKYKIKQARWLNNQDFIFDIHSNNFDIAIIDKIYNVKHTTLENNADWALGVVTGNNSKFISNKQKKGFEPIYKGKDVKNFVLGDPKSYIKFTPKKFQQVAPTNKYRAKEKLIYKFISKYLVFAYDNQQKLTLNSANILIPTIPNYPIKVIAGLLNSSLYQFIFQKKFSSIKVLRSHIEKMPLPLWDKKTLSEVIRLVDKTIQDKTNFEKLDDYIMKRYSLNQKEINYIKEFNK